jgi:4-hydroxy-2-oxoglutarate aldolase
VNAQDLRGIFAPVVTPFAADGELDRKAFEHNVAAHLAAGLKGIVVNGSTGEAALLDAREREALGGWARAQVRGDRWLVIGCGAESTRTTLKYAETAGEVGADAVLVVAPHYFGSNMTEEALRAHYLRVADESTSPVILYNIPKYMHFRLSKSLVAELSRHENVIGIKDSSGDRSSFEEYCACQSDSFTALTGNGGFVSAAAQMGGRGGIIAASLFAPGLVTSVYDAVQRKDIGAADALQARLTPVAKTIVGELGPAGVKAAMDVVGLKGGHPRSPLQPLSKADLDRVRQLLRDAELSVAA